MRYKRFKHVYRFAPVTAHEMYMGISLRTACIVPVTAQHMIYKGLICVPSLSCNQINCYMSSPVTICLPDHQVYYHPKKHEMLVVCWSTRLSIYCVCWEGKRLGAVDQSCRVRTPLWHASFKEAKCFFSAHLNNVGSLRDQWVTRSAPDRQVWISNPVSGGRCHLIHLTILGKFTWSSLTYMCTKVV